MNDVQGYLIIYSTYIHIQKHLRSGNWLEQLMKSVAANKYLLFKDFLL